MYAEHVLLHCCLRLLLAHHPVERKRELPPGFDESVYPLDRSVPARRAIDRANRKMIAGCSVCIGYASLPGHARNYLSYAGG